MKQTSTVPTTSLTIGSDPELYIGQYLPDGKTVSYKSASSYIVDNDHTKPFGLDGHSSTAELRPRPSSDPLKHADSIKRIILRYRTDEKYKDLYTMGFFSTTPVTSIGGHIHIGHEKLREGTYSIRDYKDTLVTALDSLLSFPLMFIEEPENAKKRKRSYGALSDVRGKSYGIEYRTPSSWLATEQLTRSVLCTAYTIAYEVLEKDYTLDHPITKVSLFSEAYSKHYTELLFPHLYTIIPIVRKLSLYPIYKHHIDYLFYHAVRKHVLLTTEIKKGWHVPYTRVKKLVFLSLLELIKSMSSTIAARESYTSIQKSFIDVHSDDFMIPQIASNVDKAINKSIRSYIDIIDSYNTVSLFARHKKYKDSIMIQYKPAIVPLEKIQKLSRLLADTIVSFGYPTPIKIEIRQIDEDRDIGSAAIRIGLGRPIREFGKFLPECIVFLSLLYANNGIYKSFKRSKKTGETVDLSTLSKSIVRIVRKNIIKPQKEQERVARTMRDTILNTPITTTEGPF